MVLLPKVRTAYLKSFALAIGTGLGLVPAVLLFCAGKEQSALIACVSGVGCATWGLLKPTAMRKPYELWNVAARTFAKASRLALMTISFYIIFVAVGRAGSSMKLGRPAPGDSLWSAKKPLALSGFQYEYSTAADFSRDLSWLESYFRWARETRQSWALVLLPFLAMLAAVELYSDRRFPAGVYTLF